MARVNLPVLILGESGTGKEVLARYIHSLSPQAKGPFLKVNCAAVPSELLESELSGTSKEHLPGPAAPSRESFNSVTTAPCSWMKSGKCIPACRRSFCRYCRTAPSRRLGSRTTVKVSVRILAATNIDMRAAIAQKSFREDLYYRLNGFCLTLPPVAGPPG